MSGRVSVIPLCVHAANGPGAASSLPVFATNTVLSSLVPPFHLGGWLLGIDLSGKIGSTRPGLLEVTAQVHLKPFVERGKQSSLTSPSMTKFLLKWGPHRVTAYLSFGGAGTGVWHISEMVFPCFTFVFEALWEGP